jgi:hypothetical protein
MLNEDILPSPIFNICRDNIPNNNGTSNCGFNTFSDSQESEENFDTDNNNNGDSNINIYRFKFTQDFTNNLYIFSKIHQFDHRKDFKEAWQIWVEENDEIINEEVRRLTNLKYEGNILDKMFKSARYYFRKKSTEKKEPAKRRVYLGVQKNLLESMDSHIQSNINEEDFKPSDGFESFCKENMDVVQQEVNILCKNGINNPTEIKNKIKKTYKNRYYLFITK